MGTDAVLDNNDDDRLRSMDVRLFAAVAEVIAIRREGSPTATFVKRCRRCSQRRTSSVIQLLMPKRSTRTNCCPNRCQSHPDVQRPIRVPDEDVKRSNANQVLPKTLPFSESPKMLSKLTALCLYFFQVIVQC